MSKLDKLEIINKDTGEIIENGIAVFESVRKA